MAFMLLNGELESLAASKEIEQKKAVPLTQNPKRIAEK